jgi:FXSXX-COOH protein
MSTASESSAGIDSHQWEPLIDVSNTPIADLLTQGGDTALTRSVRRLVRDLDDPNGVISAFNSFVS